MPAHCGIYFIVVMTSLYIASRKYLIKKSSTTTIENVDINECDDNNGNCTDNSYCFNIRGSHECHCERGYTRTAQGCSGKNHDDIKSEISFN